jgi:hypothetical protein
MYRLMFAILVIAVIRIIRLAQARQEISQLAKNPPQTALDQIDKTRKAI